MKERKNLKTVFLIIFIPVFMFGLAFASVPLYDLFCKVTGYGGTTNVAQYESKTISNRQIKVRFDVSLERGLGWEIKPVQRELELQLGQTGLAFYEAYNPTDKPIAAQASFNVVPFSVGNYVLFDQTSSKLGMLFLEIISNPVLGLMPFHTANLI